MQTRQGYDFAPAVWQDVISERHRHRYEFNNGFRQELEDAGMKVAGTSIDGRLVEMIEIPAHPWFVCLPVPSRVHVDATIWPPAVPGLSRQPVIHRNEVKEAASV